MSYIGKSPQTGAYSMLDTLTASATASYSLTLDSVAFVPESANHLIVSLNGTIQKAGSSYNVSGSTLTFSSTLASSDAIDFVLALGNVLDIGTPSDATVTNAKTNFVSTSSAAGLQIKGDGTTDGTLQLNCSQNSHGVKIKSPAHSSAQSYTLTLPATAPSAGKVLQTDGSGNLSFGSGGIAEADTFVLTSNLNINNNSLFLTSNLARLSTTGFEKIGTGLSESSGVFSFASTGKYLIIYQAFIISNNDANENQMFIKVSNNNFTNDTTITKLGIPATDGSVYEYGSATAQCIFDCTDTSNDKFKLAVSSSGNVTFKGNSGQIETGVTVIRLGDT